MPSKRFVSDNRTATAKRPSAQTTVRESTPATPPHAARHIQRAKVDPRALTTSDVLHLQQTVGNQAVGQILAGRAAFPIQAKLTINQPGDRYEQEADRISKRALNATAAPSLSAAPPNVQRVTGDAVGVVDSSVEGDVRQAQGGGQSIADDVRLPLERTLGVDLSAVRIHTDTRSDRLSRSIQARAFTTGRDVFFRQGEYNPGSRAGRQLIAHELTHVAQQNPRQVQRAPETSGETDLQMDRSTEVAAGQFLVEDFGQPGAGQIARSEFLAKLREQVVKVADEVLAPIGQSSENCPYIPYWFGHYAGQDVGHIEKSIRRYAPEAARAADWQTCIHLVAERVRRGFLNYRETGSLDGTPDELPDDLHVAGRRPTPQTTPSTQHIQRCDEEEKGERKKLISNEPTLTLSPGIDFGQEDQARRGNTLTLGTDWAPHNAQLYNQYDVFYKVDSNKIDVIATRPAGGLQRRIVATAGLSFKEKNGALWFTDFGSDPPFSGLGSIVLDLLTAEAQGKLLEPSGPVPGSYIFYHKKGYGRFNVPKELETIVAEGIRKQLGELGNRKKDLEDKEVIDKLKEIQKWVVQMENKYIPLKKIEYLGPK